MNDWNRVGFLFQEIGPNIVGMSSKGLIARDIGSAGTWCEQKRKRFTIIWFLVVIKEENHPHSTLDVGNWRINVIERYMPILERLRCFRFRLMWAVKSEFEFKFNVLKFCSMQSSFTLEINVLGFDRTRVFDTVTGKPGNYPPRGLRSSGYRSRKDG